VARSDVISQNTQVKRMVVCADLIISSGISDHSTPIMASRNAMISRHRIGTSTKNEKRKRFWLARLPLSKLLKTNAGRQVSMFQFDLDKRIICKPTTDDAANIAVSSPVSMLVLWIVNNWENKAARLHTERVFRYVIHGCDEEDMLQIGDRKLAIVLCLGTATKK
jgi:hypothetical protein